MSFFGFIEINAYSFTKFFSNFFEVSFTEISSILNSTEGRLKSKNLIDSEFFKESHSSCSLLVSLDSERTIFIAEGIVEFAHQKGESFRFAVVIFFLTVFAAPIEKDIFLSGMPVEVDEHSQASLFTFFLNHFLQKKYLGVMLLAGLLPLSIEVNAGS